MEFFFYNKLVMYSLADLYIFRSSLFTDFSLTFDFSFWSKSRYFGISFFYSIFFLNFNLIQKVSDNYIFFLSPCLVEL